MSLNWCTFDFSDYYVADKLAIRGQRSIRDLQADVEKACEHIEQACEHSEAADSINILNLAGCTLLDGD